MFNDKKINWQSFMKSHDLIWEQIPRCWEDSIFVGNGLLGATIYGKEDKSLS